jgi:hypothetical protein
MITWRDDPFEKGRSYRVRQSFAAMRDDFREGEVLRYKENAYSRYDGISGFFFTDEKGKIRSWDVRDDDSLTAWSELFEPLEKNPVTRGQKIGSGRYPSADKAANG